MKAVRSFITGIAVLTVLLTGCGAGDTASVPEQTSRTTVTSQPQTETSVSETKPKSDTASVQQTDADITEVSVPKEEEAMLKMEISGTPVTVEWEDNAAVKALHDLCSEGTVTIHMSMYGGFEQVGYIGADLPADDVQTVTEPGDIVLYSGDQMVVFYGSNSWSYTRLGHITDSAGFTMEDLLSNGDVTVTLSLQ